MDSVIVAVIVIVSALLGASIYRSGQLNQPVITIPKLKKTTEKLDETEWDKTQ